MAVSVRVNKALQLLQVVALACLWRALGACREWGDSVCVQVVNRYSLCCQDAFVNTDLT